MSLGEPSARCLPEANGCSLGGGVVAHSTLGIPGILGLGSVEEKTWILYSDNIFKLHLISGKKYLRMPKGGCGLRICWKAKQSKTTAHGFII